MELEVGMYVRTKDGVIGKITNEDYTYFKSWIIDTLYYNFDENVDKWTCSVKEYEISKASHTLLGNDEEPCLIEVGDYVNGCQVLNVLNFNDNTRMLSLEKIYDSNIEEEDIKSIVTKEMFSSVEYRVETN